MINIATMIRFAMKLMVFLFHDYCAARYNPTGTKQIRGDTSCAWRFQEHEHQKKEGGHCLRLRV